MHLSGPCALRSSAELLARQELLNADAASQPLRAWLAEIQARRGGAIAPDFDLRCFRAAAEAIGRPTLRFHELRHTAASLWALSGMPMERVGAALGHADTTVTYKT